jgi:hypothetical protein
MYLSYRYKGLRGGELILTTYVRSEAPPAGLDCTNHYLKLRAGIYVFIVPVQRFIMYRYVEGNF